MKSNRVWLFLWLVLGVVVSEGRLMNKFSVFRRSRSEQVSSEEDQDESRSLEKYEDIVSSKEEQDRHVSVVSHFQKAYYSNEDSDDDESDQNESESEEDKSKKDEKNKRKHGRANVLILNATPGPNPPTS